MSNRLGRNPLGAKPAPRKKKVQPTATEILQEIIAEETPKETIVHDTASEANMKSVVSESPAPQSLIERLAHWVFIDVPAESYILGLKSALLFRTVWD